MSSIHGHDDDDLHYCDGSHRWIPPRGFSPDEWGVQVRAHMQAHLKTMGGASGPVGHHPSSPVIPQQVRRKVRRDILFVPTRLGERVDRARAHNH